MEYNCTKFAKTCQNRKTKMWWQNNNQWNSVCSNCGMQMGRAAKKVWLKIYCTSPISGITTKRNLEKDSIWTNQISTQTKQDKSAKDISWFLNHTFQKRGDLIGYDGFKRILGTKIHVAVELNGLPVSIVCSPANEHDSTRFISVMENISEFADEQMISEIVTCYADKGYDAAYIRNYLRCNGINCCIPYKTNSKFIVSKNQSNIYNKTRFVVERFFGWLKNGLHRTRIRYESNCENYLGFVYLASIIMYWRVLG